MSMSSQKLQSVEMTGVARTNLQTFVRKIESLSGRTHHDVYARLATGGANNSEASVDFRIPYADYKHASSIQVNLEATDPSEVFCPGKYQTVRFDAIGRRSVPEDILVDRYLRAEETSDDVSTHELFKRYQAEVDERARTFEEAVKGVAKQYSGIRVYVDTGDAAFSGDYHRPHVRFDEVGVGGADLGQFVERCVDAVEEAVYSDYTPIRI